MTADPRRLKRFALAALIAAAILAAAVAVLGSSGVHTLVARLISAADRVVVILQDGGPWLFFAGMALLPCVGMPMMAFSFTAGPAFAAKLGMGGTVAASLAAATVNLVLTYALARRALRPLLSRLMERFGYRLPALDSGDTTDLIVILRVVPGVPFFAQNYLLGLADAPLGRYLGISCAVVWTYVSAMVLFGDALRRGSVKTAVSAATIVILAGTATHFLRRHYAGRKPAHASAQ